MYVQNVIMRKIHVYIRDMIGVQMVMKGIFVQGGVGKANIMPILMDIVKNVNTHVRINLVILENVFIVVYLVLHVRAKVR